MRFLEGLILIAILFSLLAYLVQKSRRPRWLSLLPALAALFVVIHLVVEGYRWQMVPAYALAAIVVAGMIRSVAQKAETQSETPSRIRRISALIGIALGLLVLALAAALPSISPVFSLPEPTGPHAIGTQYFCWTDEDRPDEYTADPCDFREVSVQMWYPAEPSGDEKPIPYMRQDAARALTHSQDLQDLPEFLFDHLALVRTHAYLGADVARTGSPFPVITYSISGLMSSHMTLFEELASHGYVVLCIGHPYWNPFVYRAGGEAIPFDAQNEHYKAWWAEADSAAVVEAKSQITLATTTTAQERAGLRHNELRPVAIHDLKLWAGDIGFVLDELEVMNQGAGFLAGTLDLEHIGIMGFSKGGAAAGQFCVTDERCKAGINLTGFMYGDIVNVNLDTPFFFVSEEESWAPDCFVNDLFYKRAESDAYQMKIRGARHASFGDFCLWGRLLQWANGNPPIEGERMTYIQNVYAKAFFDKHLKGMVLPLLDGPSADFPELVFRSSNNTP
jgi:predicted dienelactone hydrolase